MKIIYLIGIYLCIGMIVYELNKKYLDYQIETAIKETLAGKYGDQAQFEFETLLSWNQNIMYYIFMFVIIVMWPMILYYIIRIKIELRKLSMKMNQLVKKLKKESEK